MSLKPSQLNAVGQKYHDFEVIKSLAIPELQCWMRELVHLPTGAHVMDISNDDPENMFCLSFQTLPESSNGVAHILEHTVLCGSKKYPVKDPFFAMTRRSLNTFMNALTGSDFTCYPAASQVPKDFYNLLEVYLDAVFHPNINELSFLQEGHRLEFAIPNDPQSPLQHKGVVFNEMKGSLASANSRLAEAMNEALYPDLTYGVNSGGDPKVIPHLTYEQLCAFFRQYYHPSRCLFFFYGNMPLESHLDFITEHALKDVQKVDPLPPLQHQPRFKKPKRFSLEYPLSPEEDTQDKALVAFGWLTCHILNQQDLLALSILEIIIMDTDASPLKQALLKSGLCKQATIYMDVDISEVPVVITLKGCNPENADDLEEILRNSLKEVIHNGIPSEMIDNAMHQLEIYKSEISGNHAPFGLSLFMRSALMRQHGGSSEDGLFIHSQFDELRRRNLKEPGYLTGLLRKYFLDNPHFVRITMLPSKDLAAKEVADENAELEKMRNALSPEQVKHIVKQAADLAAFQKMQEEDDMDILPKITLEDVPSKVRDYELQHEKVGALDVFHHSCFTNGIIYADLVYDLPELKEEELPLIRLLSVLIGQLGCGKRSYSDTLEYIQANTGGVSAYLTLNYQAADHRIFSPSLYIRGKALYRKGSKLLPFMREMASSIDFNDKDRIKEVILKHYTTLHSTLNNSALRYAISLSASSLDIASKIANTWYGIDYYRAIKEIAHHIETGLDTLIEKLKMLEQRALGLENPHFIITCDKEMYNELKGNGFYGLKEIVGKKSAPWKGKFPIEPVESQGCVISSPVAFTGHVFKTIPFVHPDAPVLSIAAGLFDNLTLHSRIREQGGAYGSGAVSNSLSGNFYFYAHRDPNICSTLKAFEESINNVLLGEFDEADLEEAKLEVIQGLDSPVAPGSRGDLAYGWMREGRSLAVRQNYRDRLLATTKDDVIKAVKTHIASQYSSGATVVFAGKDLLEKENKQFEASDQSPLPIEFV